MVKRPLKDRRPLGPVLDLEDEDSSAPRPSREATDQTSDDPILEQAEEWYKQISKEKNKRKMMRNYLRSVTNLDDSEIKRRLDEANL